MADEQMDTDEFREHLEAAVRKGTSQAMKLWWEAFGKPAEIPETETDPLDELAKRRATRAA